MNAKKFHPHVRYHMRGGLLVYLGIVLGSLGTALWSGYGAVTDFLPDEAARSPRYVELSPKSESRALAIAYFIRGLLDEETDGPEKAFASFRKVLDLDPGFVDLAIRVAHEHLRHGKSAEALAVLKDALKVRPQSDVLCLALSSIYLRQLGKPELAIRYAHRALSLAPENSACYEALWEIYQSQGQSRRALQVLEKAETLKSKNPDYWLSLGEFCERIFLRSDAQISSARMDKIGRIFEKAAKLGGRNPDILKKAAGFFVLSGQWERAIPLLKEALTFQPDDQELQLRLAGSYVGAGMIDEALDMFTQLSKAHPLDPQMHDALAELYQKKGNWERAAGVLKQAILLDTSDPRRQSQLAFILLDRLHKPEEAEAVLEEACTRFPWIPEFFIWRGVAMSQSGKTAEALKFFQRMETEFQMRHPEFLTADFYFHFGAVAEQAGKVDQAVQFLRKSGDLDPAQAARTWNYIGYMWADRGMHLKESEELVRKALEAEPENAAYLDSLGWIYYQTQRYEEALAKLLKAAELLESPDEVVYGHIGDTYSRMGNQVQALSYWRKAVELNPRDKQLATKIDQVVESLAKKSSK